MGSRNINKLRAFAQDKKYVAKNGDVRYLDDEYLHDE